MSQLSAPPPTAEPQVVTEQRPPARSKLASWIKRAAVVFFCCVLAGIAIFYGFRAYRMIRGSTTNAVPTAKVQRGDLSLTIVATGSLRGQHPEILSAPMTGGNELHITALLKSGTPVQKGDVVVKFDTTEQEYKLKEAEADLAEAEQHILQAKAQQEAQEEEDRYALLKAQTDVTLAELDVRKNSLLAPIVARQNELALSSARDHQAQLLKNLTNRQATNTAAAAIQQAGQAKAQAQAVTARQNIEAMTLRAPRDGYVSVDQNQSGNFFFFGMTLPLFQIGDPARPGMAIAEIPDLKNWEVEANIGELDRGHITMGDAVDIRIIAVPTQKFTGHIKSIGGTSGPPWDRRFPCTLTIDRVSPELRPGMSARLIITTDRLQKALWLPAQALFDSDGRTFVYARSGTTFSPKDVKLVRRNETRVVISGLAEGQTVALANPLEVTKKPAQNKGGALQGIGK